MNLDTDLTPLTKIKAKKTNSKWITDLSVKYTTTKLLEDNTGNLSDLGFGEGLYTTPKG